MAQAAPSFDQPHDRNARLSLLGLTETVIENTVARGLVARRACSPFSPPSYPGYKQWAETTIALREFLAPRDWTPDDSNGFPRVVSPDGSIALTVATGDERTGIATQEPATKYPKGPETKAAVEVNEQLPFPGFAAVPDPAQPGSALRETWALLICTTELEVRYELSCPKAQAGDGRVVAWSSRIVFDPIDIESLPGRGDDSDGDSDDDGFAGIDVPVERI
jgi:hypothetical protein